MTLRRTSAYTPGRSASTPAMLAPSQAADFASKCGVKVRFSKRSHAERKLVEMHAGKTGRRLWNKATLHVYYCKYCLAYHIGHMNSRTLVEEISE